jgi:hypothetical protein
VPCKNEDGAPCKVCGATENTLWYCAFDPDQKRYWCCAGNRVQRGVLVRSNDRQHRDRRIATNVRNIEDTGWTPWILAPAPVPQRASAKKKGAKPHAQASKRKTQGPPRSAEPKKPKQKKKPTLWDDEAEDEDEDGED